MRYRVRPQTLDQQTSSRRAMLQAVEFNVEPGNRTSVTIAGEEIFMLASLQDALAAMSLSASDVETL